MKKRQTSKRSPIQIVYKRLSRLELKDTRDTVFCIISRAHPTDLQMIGLTHVVKGNPVDISRAIQVFLERHPKYIPFVNNALHEAVKSNKEKQDKEKSLAL